MKSEALGDYLREISGLKTFSRTVEVYAGLEVDFIPGLISPRDFAAQLDYTIGSIHFVETFSGGDGWEIDNTAQVFDDGLQKIFNGNIREAVSRYYELTREMIRDHTPSVVGHIDKIKMHNVQNRFFREDEGWYVDEIEKTIAALKSVDTIVEVNTRGVYQRKTETTYPSPWVVEKLRKNNVKITLSSDAHHPRDLVNGFGDAAAMLTYAGYSEIHILDDGDWKPYRIDHSSND
jgi:histidinol-phosphatase (PHP family)